MLKGEITSIKAELTDTEDKCSDNDNDQVRDVQRRKIRRINSDSENDSASEENAQLDSSEWISYTKS
jgi:hypothetical protein